MMLALEVIVALAELDVQTSTWFDPPQIAYRKTILKNRALFCTYQPLKCQKKRVEQIKVSLSWVGYFSKQPDSVNRDESLRRLVLR